MHPQWFETKNDTTVKLNDDEEAITIGRVVINLALIERVEFKSSTTDKDRWTEAALYTPGGDEPAYLLDKYDSRDLARTLRAAITTPRGPRPRRVAGSRYVPQHMETLEREHAEQEAAGRTETLG